MTSIAARRRAADSALVRIAAWRIPLSSRAGYRLLIAIHTIVAVVWFAPIVLQGEVLYLHDVTAFHRPLAEWGAAEVLRGRLPLWLPGLFAGFPAFAEGQMGSLYPPNLVAAALAPLHVAYSRLVPLHIWFSAVGMLALCGALRLHPFGAMIASLSFAYGGAVIARAGGSPNHLAALSWGPLVTALAECAATRRSLALSVVIASALALSFLAGAPQMTLYVGAFAAIYLFGRCIGAAEPRALKDRLALAARLTAPLVLCLPLAAVQLLPTAELAAESVRSGGLSLARLAEHSLPPEALVTAVVPHFFGSPWHLTYWGREGFNETALYIGLVPLAFATAFALPALRSDPRVRLLGALALICFVLSLGSYSPLTRLLAHVPVLNGFTAPARFLVPATLGLATLAGVGASHLAAQPPAQFAVLCRRLRLILFATGTLLGLASLAGLAAESSVTQLGQWLIATGFRSFEGRLLSIAQYQERVPLVLSDVRAAMVATAGVALAGACVSHAGALQWIGRRAALMLLVSLTVVDLWLFGLEVNPTLPPTAVESAPATAAAILAQPSGPFGLPYRTLIAGPVTTWPWSYDQHREALTGNSGALYGLHLFNGYSSLQLRRHAEYTGVLLSALSQSLEGPKSLWPLQVAGIGFVVTGRQPVPSHPDLVPIFTGPHYSVYQVARPLPRVFFASEFPSSSLLPASLTQEGVVFSGQQAFCVPPCRQFAGDGSPSAGVVVQTYSPTVLSVDVAAPHDGLLVIADAFYPGWRVKVDGMNSPVAPVNGFFRGVPVTQGEHTVELGFDPFSVRAGLAVSATSWSVLVASAIWTAWQHFVGRWV